MDQPHAQWFDALGTCRGCGKAATGVIRGTRNQSYGPACKRCAEAAIKAAHRKRQFYPDIELAAETIAREPVASTASTPDGSTP